MEIWMMFVCCEEGKATVIASNFIILKRARAPRFAGRPYYSPLAHLLIALQPGRLDVGSIEATTPPLDTNTILFLLNSHICNKASSSTSDP
jgi:hypothetical protein